MKNKRYLCYQILVTKDEFVGNTKDIKLDIIVRNVGGKNDNEALGKFIKETLKVEAVKRLDPTCFLLDTLMEID